MSFRIGNKITIEVEGASHAPEIRVTLAGLPAGEKISLEAVQQLLDRRAGGRNAFSTPRRESDRPVSVSGIREGVTTGDPITAVFANTDVRREDYEKIRKIPRPSHADYAAWMKYQGNVDLSGGGFFSGRMTLPMCFAGAVCMQILEKRGILIGAHIASIGEIQDACYDGTEDCLEMYAPGSLPVLNGQAGQKMLRCMEETAAEQDSIGGVIECKITGIPAGVGDPIYDSLESRISYGMFGIPGIKGIEFGDGFNISGMKGSEANDEFCIREGEVRCRTNHSGGIQGGISNGMPILFRVAVKPTPSIGKPQRSVDLETMKETELVIGGRHDACIVPRVVPCVEAMSAIVLINEIKIWQ